MNRLLDLPESYQQCRENRHPWSNHNVIEHRYEVEQVQICPRCGNERSRKLSRRKATYGHITQKWQIRYTAENYLMKGLDSPISEDEFGEMRMQLIGFPKG